MESHRRWRTQKRSNPVSYPYAKNRVHYRWYKFVLDVLFLTRLLVAPHVLGRWRMVPVWSFNCILYFCSVGEVHWTFRRCLSSGHFAVQCKFILTKVINGLLMLFLNPRHTKSSWELGYHVFMLSTSTWNLSVGFKERGVNYEGVLYTSLLLNFAGTQFRDFGQTVLRGVSFSWFQ